MENIKKEMNQLNQKTDTANYDVEDSEKVIIELSESKNFENILELINGSCKRIDSIKKREKYVPSKGVETNKEDQNNTNTNTTTTTSNDEKQEDITFKTF